MEDTNPFQFFDPNQNIYCIEAEPTLNRACNNNEHGLKQVQQYINGSKGFYSAGFVVGPFIGPKDFPNIGTIGYISCNENGEIVFKPPVLSTL